MNKRWVRWESEREALMFKCLFNGTQFSPWKTFCCLFFTFLFIVVQITHRNTGHVCILQGCQDSSTKQQSYLFIYSFNLGGKVSSFGFRSLQFIIYHFKWFSYCHLFFIVKKVFDKHRLFFVNDMNTDTDVSQASFLGFPVKALVPWWHLSG